MDSSFATALARLLNQGVDKRHLKKEADLFRNAFFAHGSETPDNVNCMKHITIGLAKDETHKTVCGLRLRGKPISLSQILNHAESDQPPAHVSEIFPGLSGDEWAAITRLVTMVFTTLEQD